MKNFNLIALYICLAMLTIGVSSCKDGDEPQGSQSTSQKRITRIVHEYGAWDGLIHTLVYELQYNSNGQLTKFFAAYDDDDGYNNIEFAQTLSYSGGKVIISGEADGDICEQIYTLNSDGYAVSCHTDNGSDENLTFEYEGGYLTKLSGSNDESEFSYSCNYTDGNMMSVKAIINYDYGVTVTYKCTYIFSYWGSYLNTNGIPNYILSEDLFGEYKAAFYAGILGKPCRLLADIMEVPDDGISYFICSYDGNGNVKSMRIRKTNGRWDSYTFSYND